MSKWKKLEHNGPYIPEKANRKVQVIVRNKPYILVGLAGEMAYHWAAKIKTDYVKDRIFQKNFWKDFSKVIPDELRETKWPDDWNFESAYNNIIEEREAKKRRSKGIHKDKEGPT